MAMLSFVKTPGASDLTCEPVADTHAPAPGRASVSHSALLMRIALFNLLAIGLTAAAWQEGYLHLIIEADQTGLSIAIGIVFLAGLYLALWRAAQISRETDALENDAMENVSTPASLPAASASLRLRLSQRIAVVRHIANTLVLLGLIGTVLGFIIALSGVDPDNAADVAGIAPMVSTLIQGMSTALYTTLVGSILNLWLMANYQLLSGATVHLMSLWLDRTEADART